MDLTAYLDYVSAFNSQDWIHVINKYYSPDVAMKFPVASLNGREEVLNWYTKAHESIFETLVLSAVEFEEGGALITADLTVQFILLGPTEYSPLDRPGQAGDVLEIPMRARYGIGPDGLIGTLTVDITGTPIERRIGKD